MLLCLGTSPAVQRVMRFDRCLRGEVNRAREIWECPSGKSINAAKVARAMGADVLAMGFAGGRTGQVLRDGLTALGVAHDLVEMDRPTRTCVTILEYSSNDATELVEESPHVSAAALEELRRRFSAALPKAKMLLLSGTLAPGVPPDFYAQCAREADGQNIPTIIDAVGEPLRLALSHQPLLIKPNRSELARTVGHAVHTPEFMRKAIRDVVERGARWVLVSAGPAEVILADATRFWKISIPVIQPINAIGSGDALAGGLAAAMLAGESLPESVTAGIAAAVSNALQILPGQIDPPQASHIRAGLQLEPVNDLQSVRLYP